MTNRNSLGEKIAKKISSWVLTLVISVVVMILLVAFVLSRQMFDKQIDIWNVIVPQQILTNLIDSDHFSIQREVDVVKSTGLFSSGVIADSNKHPIASFGSLLTGEDWIPITDDAKVTWGYYELYPNFYNFIFPFILAAVGFLTIIFIIYFIVRYRIKASLDGEFILFNNFLTEIENLTYQLPDMLKKFDEPSFSMDSAYNREQLIIKRSIARLLDEINKVNLSLNEAVRLTEQKKFQDELTKTALQVVHDLGSPLAVLEIIQLTALSLPEENRTLIRNSCAKIREISNVLLKKAKQEFSSDSEYKDQQLYSLVNQIINEKRIQYGENIKLELLSDKLSINIFVKVNRTDFGRVLSNLINNSVDAIQNNKRICISITDVEDNVEIKIEDFGKGIPEKVIKKLGSLGASFGKLHGTGVGLNHAINSIEDCGGVLTIHSTEGVGTVVCISLPKVQTPAWYVSEIKISPKQVVVAVDDDTLIHSIWKEKFKEMNIKNNCDIKLFHFMSPDKLINWHMMNHTPDILYLCDYEFIGSSATGLDLITMLKINKQAYLVTSSVLDDVYTKCEQEEIKLIPKDIVHMTALRVL